MAWAPAWEAGSHPECHRRFEPQAQGEILRLTGAGRELHTYRGHVERRSLQWLPKASCLAVLLHGNPDAVSYRALCQSEVWAVAERASVLCLWARSALGREGVREK